MKFPSSVIAVLNNYSFSKFNSVFIYQAFKRKFVNMFPRLPILQLLGDFDTFSFQKKVDIVTFRITFTLNVYPGHPASRVSNVIFKLKIPHNRI